MNFNITEEMLSLQSMKDTTTGEDIFQELKKSMARLNVKFDKLHGISTDGAPAMVGNKLDLIAKIKSEMTNMNLDAKELYVLHCIIHQQNSCAKAIKFFCHVNSDYVY